jgi:hypothetical protein
MSEMELKTEAETEAFTEELSDEALDRETEGGTLRICAFCSPSGG